MYGLRGFGDTAEVIPPCSSLNLPPGFVGPVLCDPATGPPQYPASQSQVGDLAQQIQDLQAKTIIPGISNTALAWGAGGFGFLLLVMGMRR